MVHHTLSDVKAWFRSATDVFAKLGVENRILEEFRLRVQEVTSAIVRDVGLSAGAIPDPRTQIPDSAEERFREVQEWVEECVAKATLAKRTKGKNPDCPTADERV